ncbi:PREDICTED: zinc transporter 6-A-like [Amphimedon queenslandica]|uniref:Cation efflux protein transmembrane domain-containing protein n=1 Tax=Amphimedon queenslandica TaxID=400682 RepID=A0A1X7VXT7_AMPQE|nr:PREDICTED: zinc transporter 6-A-like [Amphimedon queenslandica]|eukprot:XP_003382471.1 PREDICTED: zinc transporter 6-A-like [Amphimedon queenslandica]
MAAMKQFQALMKDKKLWRPVSLLVVVLPMTLLLFYWCHVSDSLALTSFTYLALFNIGVLIVHIVSVWASRQVPNNEFNYGYERVNVLAVFSVSIIMILCGVVLVKHSLERLFDPPAVTMNNLFLGLGVGLFIHYSVLILMDNQPLLHAAEVATPNWLQNALGDLGQSVCGLSPPLGRLLLYRLNPFSLMAVGCSISVLTAKVLIDLDDLHLADVTAAIFNSALICGTMLPLSIYTGKLLLQTAPEHILPLLDKSMKEASTMDGVLEIKNEHFWTVTFGSYVGSLQVRVRRDADEQEVLKKVTSCLSSQLNDLTIQVVKDDWNIPLSLSRPSPTPSRTANVHGSSQQQGGYVS